MKTRIEEILERFKRGHWAATEAKTAIKLLREYKKQNESDANRLRDEFIVQEALRQADLATLRARIHDLELKLKAWNSELETLRAELKERE